MFIGDDIPTDAVQDFKLPNDGARKQRLFTGFLINGKPMANCYGELSYQYNGNKYYLCGSFNEDF